jgi:hypothetical protein
MHASIAFPKIIFLAASIAVTVFIVGAGVMARPARADVATRCDWNGCAYIHCNWTGDRCYREDEYRHYYRGYRNDYSDDDYLDRPYSGYGYPGYPPHRYARRYDDEYDYDRDDYRDRFNERDSDDDDD